MSLSKSNGRYPKEWSHLPSVTTVLNILISPRLRGWLTKNAYADIAATREKSTSIGSTVHHVIEQIEKEEKVSLETDYPTEVKQAIENYFIWKKEKNLKPLCSEVKLMSDDLGFKGTFDRVAISGEKLLMLDWKTAKAIYPDQMLQIVAYKKLFEAEKKLVIDECWIIQIDKEQAGVHPYMIPKDEEEEIWNHFKNLLATYKWYDKKESD